MGVEIPFIGRERDIERLRKFHATRKHALIFGQPGVGKTVLVQRISGLVSLVVSARSDTMRHICENLEAELHLTSAEGRLPKRKQRLVSALSAIGKTVVFDQVGRTTPKISSFLGCVCERVPVWVCARSPHSWDIGHFWTMLFRFEQIKLHPFHLSETRALVKGCVEKGYIPASALGAVKRLQRLSQGLPQVLGELIEGLASGNYDPANLFDLELLDLDRRIEHLPIASFQTAPPTPHPS